MKHRVFAAVVLLFLAGASYSLAAWSYLGVLGKFYGEFRPGGVLESFTVDAGEIYAGMNKTVEATATIHVPEDAVVEFYAVPSLEINIPENHSGGFNYTVQVFIDGQYRGSFGNTHNLTINIQQGRHIVKVIATIQAPTWINETTPFSLTIYMKA